MEITKEVKERYIIAIPSGKIDATNSDEFANSLLELLKEKENIIVNFKDIDYISSAGLRSVLIVAKQTQAKNGKFILCEMKDHIFDIFKITGFTQMLTVVKTISEAIKLVEE